MIRDFLRRLFGKRALVGDGDAARRRVAGDSSSGDVKLETYYDLASGEFRYLLSIPANHMVMAQRGHALIFRERMDKPSSIAFKMLALHFLVDHIEDRARYTEIGRLSQDVDEPPEKPAA